MGRVVVLGVFVADGTYHAERMPRMGETVLGQGFALGPGGKGSNQAVAAALLGADTHLITKLGQDPFADMAHKVWSDAGVTPHAEQLAESYTGSAFIYIDQSTGDNAIIIAPGAGAYLSQGDLVAKADLIAKADVFMTQLEQPMEAALKGLELARNAGVTTILNPAPAAPLSDEMLALCDHITPNETETEAITGITVQTSADAAKACDVLTNKGVQTPIITMGAEGAYLHGHGMVPAINAGNVVETTGAGDAFNAGFATGLSEGMSHLDAVKFGCATAGISVTRPGAAASMPSRAEVATLLGD